MAQDPRRLLAQADKAYSSISTGSALARAASFFGISSPSTDKSEDAAALYVKAAVAYRVQNKGLESGRAYEKAATIQRNINELNDMANTLIEASKAYRKDSPGDALRVLSQVVQHFIDDGGNFRRAARYQEELADLYVEQGDSAQARAAFALAAQWFEGDNAIMNANKLSVKSADIAALEGDYLDAINRFEHAADLCLLKDAMKWSAPNYLLQAGYCHLLLDIVGAMRALQGYQNMASSLPVGDRQIAWLGGLMETVERGDTKAFEDKQKERYGYHSTSTPEDRERPTRTMTPWEETMFTRISKEMKAKEEDFS